MSDRLKVAVVGAGGWGEQHARVFSGRRDTDLVAIVGRSPERTRARAEAFETTGYTEIDVMLEAEQPDLVTVCLPNEGHFEPTLHLIERGVPLLVEKPFVFRLDQADRLLAAAAERDLFLGDQLQPPLCRARAAGQGRDRRGRAGRDRVRDLAVRR